MKEVKATLEALWIIGLIIGIHVTSKVIRITTGLVFAEPNEEQTFEEMTHPFEAWQ